MNESMHVLMTSDEVESKTDYTVINSKKYLYRILKRLFDILGALTGLVLLIPLSIIIKIAYILSGDLNSIFFTQKRIGLNGKVFNFYKFRTMIPNADEELKKILSSNKDLKKEYKINKKLKDDPRITKVGKFIRRSSIDELPQVINILLGQMTFVGNRPYLPREKKDMKDYYDTVVSTKPGLTGYWQISGRSETTFDKRLELEKFYSEHCSFKLDTKIFFKTFKVVFLRKGAK